MKYWEEKKEQRETELERITETAIGYEVRQGNKRRILNCTVSADSEKFIVTMTSMSQFKDVWVATSEVEVSMSLSDADSFFTDASKLVTDAIRYFRDPSLDYVDHA